MIFETEPENNYLLLCNDLIKSGKTVKMPVRGMSMFPFFNSGDMVIVGSVSFNKLKNGQIVVFKNNGIWVMHRIVSIKRDAGLIYTRGDCMFKGDKPIKMSDVVGVVTGIDYSRWRISYLAIGKPAPYLALLSPLSGPVLRFMVKIYGYFKK